MARFEFTVPALPDPDLRVRLDTAYDGSGVTVTDVLIGGRVADGAQGFDLRGVGTFLGPDGVDTLYAKLLDYRGTVVTAGIELDGAAAGGGGGGASEPLAVYKYTVTNASAALDGDNPLALVAVGDAPTGLPDSDDWDNAVGIGSPVLCAELPAGVYLASFQWHTDQTAGGEYAYYEPIEGTAVMPFHPGTADEQVPAYTQFAISDTTHFAVLVGADTPDPDHQNFNVDGLIFIKIGDLA